MEDRRGRPVRGLAMGGGLGTLLIVLLFAVLNGRLGFVPNQNPGPGARPAQNGAGDDQLKQFVAVVLADTEDVWHELFRERFGRPYQEPKLVLFSGAAQSGCGFASGAVGPFYCPADQNVYLELAFFDELRERFGAPGDFAAAYVIGHEVAHHVQHQLGTTEQVHRMRRQLSDDEYNRLSVRLELQADFLAGVWAHHAQRTRQILEPGDVEEALRAASAIGDDRIQRQGQGYVVPDSFTHGSSEQRVRWFRRGLETGDVSLMDELFERDYDRL